MRKIVIIGANGYIARNLIFVTKECKDIEFKLYGSKTEHADSEPKYQSIDILDKESIKKIDMDCDAIFMLVGKTGSANGFDDYNTFINYNEIALLNVLDEYRRQESKAKIIFPSTRLVYKGCSGAQDEQSEKEFKTVYAINKFACEQYLEQFNRVFDVQYCILRICLPYGTLVEGASSYGTAEFMLSKVKNREDISLYGDGSQRRTLIYIRDLCQIMLDAAMSDQCSNDVYNVGGEDFSLKEMAEVIAENSGIGIQYNDWPEMAYKIESGSTVFDSNKIDKILNHRYSENFKDWVEKNVTSY